MDTIHKGNIKLAIVGCGAIAEKQHLPSLVRQEHCQVTTLVDSDRARAGQLAKRFEIPKVLADYRSLLDSGVDAVIVALPNHLHALVSIELLRAGLHVLVEKPMATSVAECDAMLAAAEAGQAVLSVGLMRRFSHAGRFTKWAIDNGLLGRVISFDLQNGFAVSKWPFATDFFLRREMAGGGTLMDLGVHTLDQMLWWLGDVDTFTYYDDSYGGLESECKLHLTLSSGVEGIIELSRTRDLRETAIICGERAELEVSLVKNFVSLRSLEGNIGLSGHAILAGEPILQDQLVADLISAEHRDFLDAILTGRQVTVPGTEARRSIALIEECYRARLPLSLPWVEVRSDTPELNREA
jgi:predicted dehydrogenase